MPTMFEECYFNRLSGESRTRGRFDGRPCRYDEEESCNKFHATCARVLKYGGLKEGLLGNFDKIQPPCRPEEPGPAGAAAAKAATAKAAADAAAVGDKRAAGTKSEGREMATCNARLIDLPWGLMNPEAAKDEDKSLSQIVGIRRQARVQPPQSVWGLAVHGKSGTFSFDSGSPHIADYIYSVPQGNGLPHDYYVCDSRTNPSACALIGGNLRHACAEWYDPRQCNFCEDHGLSLTCEIHGWNNKYLEWHRVPIYPRDLLGEQYKGEFRDVMGRPAWASITIPKWVLRAPAKELPGYMVQDYEPLDAVEQWYKGPNKTQHAAAAVMTESRGPDPTLAAPLLGFQRLPDSPSSHKVRTREQKKMARVNAREFL